MQRVESIDIAKGFGIVAVVVGHVTTNEPLRSAIFLWHMPLFFFLSGYLFKPGRGIGPVARSRALSLLVPYAAFLIVLALPHLVNAWKRGGSGELLSFAATLGYGGRDLTGWFSVFWFVTCLYVTQIAVAWAASQLGRPGLVAFSFASLVLGYGLAQWLPDLRTPGNIAVAAFAVPIFVAGHFKATTQTTLPSFAVVAVAALGVAAAATGLLPTLDMKSQQYGAPVLTLLISLASVVAILRLAGRLEGTTAGRIAAYIGAASLVVMFTHQAVQLVMLEKLHVVSQLARIAASIGVGVLAYEALRRTAATRALFLGVWPVTTASR